MPQATDLEWVAAISEEERAAALLYEVGTKDPASAGELARSWFGAIERLLRLAAIRCARDRTAEAFVPPEFALRLAGISGYLAAGILPEPVAITVKHGRSRMGPSERRDIGIAVAYRRAAEARMVHNGISLRIEDRAPVKTITDAYGVKPNTVRDWCRKFQPAFLGVGDATPEILRSLMQQAGARYRSAGRSKNALDRRASKRSPKARTSNALGDGQT